LTANASPAGEYAKGKSFTARRTRSAQMIESFLLQKRPILRNLLTADEAKMRKVVKEWPVSPTVRGFRSPLQIGTFALLAYPGTLLESIREDEEIISTKTRLLIKATVSGTIFNIVCTLAGDDLAWTWQSQEFRSDMVSADALGALKQAIKQLVETEIPLILTRLESQPA
jgi:hypothetical protein